MSQVKMFQPREEAEKFLQVLSGLKRRKPVEVLRNIGSRSCFIAYSQRVATKLSASLQKERKPIKFFSADLPSSPAAPLPYGTHAFSRREDQEIGHYDAGNIRQPCNIGVAKT
jgi:hypothetical protein